MPLECCHAGASLCQPLCWQSMVVFCPDSSALGSLCKGSFQSSYFLTSALPELSPGGEQRSLDEALLPSSAQRSESSSVSAGNATS